MISIVVVSHSRALAEAAVALAGEMVDKAQLPSMSVAAGLDETTFGTDAAAVAEAITTVDSPDGVLVLLDLGSAVLSAEMALEFLDPEVAERVVVSSAPLVEGLVAAVVTASSGAPIDAVVAEAVRGLAAKQDHLGDAVDASPAPTESSPPLDEQTLELQVTNTHGLHARPAAKLVSLVRSFDASLTATNVSHGKGPVDAASLPLVATLNVRQGDRLRLGATGPQAAEALAAVAELAERSFGDEAGAGPGGFGLDIAMGPAIVHDPELNTSTYVAGTVDDELAASGAAVEAVGAELARIRENAVQRIGQHEAEIFTAQIAILHDRSLESTATTQISAGVPSVQAWTTTLDGVASTFEALEDTYQRARAQDIRSIKRFLLAALMGDTEAAPSVSSSAAGVHGGIVIVAELDAATAAMLDTDSVSGVVTLRGGATGHGVIVTQSRGIPLLTDAGEAAASVESGTLVAFDSRAGEFVVSPDAAQQQRFRAEIAARTAEQRKART